LPRVSKYGYNKQLMFYNVYYHTLKPFPQDESIREDSNVFTL